MRGTRLSALLPVLYQHAGQQQVIKLAPKSIFPQRRLRFAQCPRQLRSLDTEKATLLSTKHKMAPTSSPVKRIHVDSAGDVSASKERIVLKFSKCREEAQAPKRGSEGAAGFDLYSVSEIVIPKRGQAMVKTGIKIALPDNCYGRIAPRSGLALKHSIDVGAGVIDRDYRGEIGVILFNFSDVDYTVTKGLRIAQLICERIYMPELEECTQLDETTRGSGGYGSSGMN